MRRVLLQILSVSMMVICLFGSTGINMFFHHCFEHNQSDYALLYPDNWHEDESCDHHHATDSHSHSANCCDFHSEDLSSCCVVDHMFVKQDLLLTIQDRTELRVPVLHLLLKYTADQTTRLDVDRWTGVGVADDALFDSINLQMHQGTPSLCMSLCKLKLDCLKV
ncbi:hypothetical protein OAT16_00085 [Prolixibacteraceae bacterium]|nr:hypothetical protein [Prolixibacteraceae bacterium]